jgi:uncharacterized repeat protein (TIGR02059 family)
MKKAIIIAFLFISVALNATNYYVKTGGNDSYTGLSDGQAWQTVEKVNAFTFQPGDVIHFKRGDTWRTRLSVKSGDASAYITYTAYSVGAKPLFLGSVQANSTGDWTEVSANIWQNSNAAFTVDVANLIFNNEESCGTKIMSATPMLDAQGEFWYDFVNNRIRLYSVGNPAKFYTNIECAVNNRILYFGNTGYSKNYIIIENLDYRYATYGAVLQSCHDVIFRDCDFSYIGGGDQWSDYTVRYGDPITIEDDSHDILVERCHMSQCYDGGLTNQMSTAGHHQTNIYYYYNIIEKCDMSFAPMCRGAGSTMDNIHFENNIILNSGEGWGHNQRPEGYLYHVGHAVSIFSCLSFGATITNFYIRNNIFYEGIGSLIYFSDGADVPTFIFDNNVLYQSSGNIGMIYPINYATLVDWQTVSSQDANSIAADPLFVSTTDFHLQIGSPAIDAGVDLGLTLDFKGNPIIGLPDIGAFETQISSDTPTPLYLSSVFQNASPSRLEMNYNLSLVNIIPAVSAFTVRVNSVARTLNSVAISGTKVFLTLASPVVYGDVVTVAYTKPATNPLQTPAGGQAATIAAQSVTNNVVATPNTAPVVVINSAPNNLSGFVGEIDATGSYDPNNDNLSYTWVVPNNIPVSSTTGSKIQFLSPIVNAPQKVEFTLKISDGITPPQIKVIPVEILPYKPDLEVAEVLNVEASSFQSPNYPHNILDGNTGTMWAVKGDNQWLILELKEPFNIQHVRLAFRLGQRKESYFDILGSEDNVTWEPILTKSASCPFSGDNQVFDFPPSKTEKEFKYVKLVGQSNSVDSWNYISEFKIFGYKHRNPLSYEEQPVKIYPNPAHDFFNISIQDPTLEPHIIKISDLYGKIVFIDPIEQDIKNVQIPGNLKTGIYIVTLESSSLILYAQKLIIHK